MAQLGFFTKKILNAPASKKMRAPLQSKSLQSKPTRTLDCSGCGLDKHCQSPRMAATGRGKLGILIIAEAPGKDEDARGEQLVGEAGQTMRRALSKYGIDIYQDCRKINAVNCRPFTSKDGHESNRAPEYFEIECCRSHVWKEIEEFKPKLILLLGNHAIESFLGHRWPYELGGINKWRGWTIPDRDTYAWVCPIFHPSYINKTREYEPVVEVIWDQDIEKAIACLDKPFPEYIDERKCVEILPARLADDNAPLDSIKLTVDEEAEIVNRIHELHNTAPGLFYFDFECNSRKPYLPGRKILSCAISINEDKTISFPITDVILNALMLPLSDPLLPKAAQNMKFEDAWANTHVFFDSQRNGSCVRGWKWDSMIGANILDNRKGVSGLKFQAYVNDGIIDYSSHLDKYMDADDGEDSKDANAINKLAQAPASEVLLYGGIDALLGRRYSLIQMQKINADSELLKAYNLFHAGTITMASMEQNGMCIDIPYVQSQYKHIIDRRVPAMQKSLSENDAIIKWKARYGDKFNLGSDAQLGTVLVNDLNVELPETKGSSEKKRRYKTDTKTLEDIEDEVPFVKDIADIERLKKVANTNLKGLMREAPDGILHPFFNLSGDADGNHVVTSYRSGSSHINFQNQPKRNPELERIARRAFITREGMQRLSVDFKGAEVVISCCVHKDPTMIAYVTDKNTDMHRDMCKQLYMLNDNEWTKACRQSAKNHFVFPEFYGDWWKSTAYELWCAIKKEQLTTQSGLSLYAHLADKNIKQYQCKHCADVEAKRKKHRKDEACCFENHVRLVEDDFWNRRFRVYTQWKKEHMREYERNGFFYLLTGFKVSGVLRKNQALNLPIQGPAFHCLLWALERIWHREYGIAAREKWRSIPVGQIHDSSEQDIFPEERNHIIKTYNHVITEELPQAFPWIVVPMTAEFSITPVGASWYDSEEI